MKTVNTAPELPEDSLPSSTFSISRTGEGEEGKIQPGGKLNSKNKNMDLIRKSEKEVGKKSVVSSPSVCSTMTDSSDVVLSKSIFTGHLEPTFITSHAFDSLSKSFTSTPFIESKKRSQNFHSHASSPLVPPDFHSRKRVAKGDSSDTTGYLGPWAGYEGELKGSTALNPSQEELEEAGLGLDAKDSKSRNRLKKDDVPMESERSTFHGKSLRDYQGRTYMSPPTDISVNLFGEPGELK